MTKGTLFFAIFLLSLSVGTAFALGRQMEFWDMKLAAINHECGHYDQHTANFTWGPPNDASFEAMPLKGEKK